VEYVHEYVNVVTPVDKLPDTSPKNAYKVYKRHQESFQLLLVQAGIEKSLLKSTITLSPD
jgi:hypothetical protein